MRNKKFSDSFNGKGYYIALILCAVAIGISGYLYYYNANRLDANANPPDATVGATLPSGNPDVPVVATQPTLSEKEDPVPGESLPPVTKKPIRTAAPVDGKIVCDYAMDCLSYNATTRDWRVHDGVDFAAEANAPVFASADGTVSAVYEDETMGYTVVLTHENGYATCYASLSANICVAVGDDVRMGQTLGYVGNSTLLESAVGDHLHFSVACNGQSVDPAAFLSEE